MVNLRQTRLPACWRRGDKDSIGNHARRPTRQLGFNLVEVAIALVILALALGGIISAFAPQLANRGFTSTQAQLADVNQAVLAFAESNGRLPCPATPASGGLESFCTTPTGVCTVAVPPNLPAAVVTSRGRCSAATNTGFIPALTLGLVGQGSRGTVVDAWAGTLQYVVTAVTNIANNASPTPFITPACGAGVDTCIPLTQIDGVKNAYYNQPGTLVSPASDIFVCNTATGIAATTCGTAQQRANPAYVIFSLGQVRAARGTDETANTNADRVFVSHERTDDATPGPNSGFDDLFVWATIDQVRARMVASKVVP
jgi:prepilin-type N-terminal cleavage/methylation domain-containing protein